VKVIDTSTGEKHSVVILPVELDDFKTLRKDRYLFDWKAEKNQEVYKLQFRGSSDILGLVSIERILQEWRIHIRLLTVSNKERESDATAFMKARLMRMRNLSEDQTTKAKLLQLKLKWRSI